MRILILGGGGREHALAWACLRDRDDVELICAPGNAGTAELADNVALDVTDTDRIAGLAVERAVDLVVIGPDASAAAGVADACHAAGIAVFGPTAAAARIESSKTFAKTLMEVAGIPTARWMSGGAGERTQLRSFIAQLDGWCVVKADGLALGKGVTVCDSVDTAERALAGCLDERLFGEAGSTVIVEERLEGTELSAFGLSDGRRVRGLAPARDHKRALDGDRGPNTGGMGAVAPAPDVDADGIVRDAVHTVLQPCVDALAAFGSPFVGCLYAGLMLTPAGISVLEFNARFGDPEAQVVLPLLDEPLVELLTACVDGRLDAGIARRGPGAAVGVVAAAEGYPGAVRTGDVIDGVDSLSDGVLCFHAGTRSDNGTLRTSGGRVLCVVGLGSDHTAARRRAYANIARIRFRGIQYRSDIAEETRTPDTVH